MAIDAKQIKNIFNQFDKDSNGTISEDELTTVLMELNPSFTIVQCHQLFDQIDKNHDHSLFYEEFVDWLNGKDSSGYAAHGRLVAKHVNADAGEGMSDERRRKLLHKFARLDTTGDSRLDFMEVHEFLSKRFPGMEIPDLKLLFDCADKDHSGRLDFLELMDLIITVPTSKPKDGYPAFAKPLVPLKAKEMKMMEEAQSAYERDQARLLAKINDLAKEVEHVRDVDAKHKKFQENHQKIMRDFYTTHGHN
jgi:Ca2+-binding EF-hand superfamily protein